MVQTTVFPVDAMFLSTCQLYICNCDNILLKFLIYLDDVLGHVGIEAGRRLVAKH